MADLQMFFFQMNPIFTWLKIKTEHDLKKILRGATVAEVLNKIRSRTYQSDSQIYVKPVNQV